MKPAPFEYRRPATVAGALADLAAAEGARVLAGGQSLVPLLNLRLATPPVVVDINRVEGLDAVVEREGRVHIGATARQSAVLASELVRSRLPLVAAALARVAHPQVRARGTVVGNLCHHDPASEMPAVAVALDAEFTVVAPDGSAATSPPPTSSSAPSPSPSRPAAWSPASRSRSPRQAPAPASTRSPARPRTSR
ncbi:protein of unknown function [Modestobacter italicus]|uniref:FAD-binding PCMH-type domain-containing protein n=1 Tax=Modestobacter italicus (strain DSM 44449 / CECT 9708 / BC 501) TaxID=2732864 RepID=I4F1I5_MODI5|nr:FAD binding domain-containing protein [Modestobacter marinus]CCH89498.1 protein of unknown function [Modestobacter marinus]